MQSFKAFLMAIRSSHNRRFLSRYRSFSAQPRWAEAYAQIGDFRNQVLVEGKTNARISILNRLSSLNALTTSMMARLKKLYECWEENNEIGFVMMKNLEFLKGSGRAFCSGADVVTLSISQRRLEIIDKCFHHETVEKIIDALAANSYDEWCTSIVKKLKEASPLSLKVSLRSIREGRFQSLDQCLVREYRMSLNGISKRVSDDFCEGVRARLVDKDFAPKWDPPTLEQVTEDMVDCFFLPLK